MSEASASASISSLSSISVRPAATASVVAPVCRIAGMVSRPTTGTSNSKCSRRREHLLFDVPVVGRDTIPAMRHTGATTLAVAAGRTLMLDKEDMLADADASDIAIVGLEG